MIILTTMAKLFLALGCGFYLYRKGIFTQEVSKGLSGFIIKISGPLLTLYSISTVDHSAMEEVLRMFGAGVAFYVLLPFLALVLAYALRAPKDLRGSYMNMFIFANTGYMCIPVVQAVYGDSAIFYITLFNMPFNLLFYTYGLYLCRRDAELTYGAQGKTGVKLSTFINSGTVASILALVIYFANIQLPSAFYQVIGFVGNATMPLSMVTIGSSVAAASFADLRTEKRIWPMMLLRLCVMPLLCWLFLQLFLTDKNLIRVCTVSIGMPVGTIVAMASAGYERQSKVTSIAVALSTLCSIATVPIMLYLLSLY